MPGVIPYREIKEKTPFDLKWTCGLAAARKNQKEVIRMGNDNNSLSHTTWNCKYHIVFAPKYRRQLIYGELKVEIGKILRELCEWKGIKIIEAELCPDHIHKLVEIPPKFSVSGVVGFLKGKSSLLIHERHGNLKYKYGNRSFWCRGFPTIPFAVGASTAASRASGQLWCFARITGRNDGNRPTEGCHGSLYPISHEGGDIPSPST